MYLIHSQSRKDKSDSEIYSIIENALTKRKWKPLTDNIDDLTGWNLN